MSDRATECRYEATADGARCSKCGHTRAIPPGFTLDQLRRHCPTLKPPETPSGPRAKPIYGPGSELRAILKRICVSEKPGCDCAAKMRTMDGWGVAGCLQHFDEIVGWMREGHQRFGWCEKAVAGGLALITGLAFQLDWRDPWPSLIRLAIDRTLKIFVVGHEPARLAAIGERPHLRKVSLPDLTPPRLKTPFRQLAENRIYFSDVLHGCPATFVGVAAASWNEKYSGAIWKGLRTPHCLPLERLDELSLSENLVWAAHPNPDHGVIQGLSQFLPGLRGLVSEALERLGRSPHLPRAGGLLANNFVAHRDVVADLVKFQREALTYLDDKHGPAWPLKDRLNDPAVTCRLPAFLGEALTICYFAARSDLIIKQIPQP